jgi:hypothetical protein
MYIRGRKMKYKGIICFVYQKEKKEILQAIGKNSVIFSEDFNDSKKSNLNSIISLFL